MKLMIIIIVAVSILIYGLTFDYGEAFESWKATHKAVEEMYDALEKREQERLEKK